MAFGMTDDDDIDVLTTRQAAAAAGVTARQLEWLVISGIIRPFKEATGSGSKRRWAASQVKLLRLAAALREHGATDASLRPAIASAERLTDAAWDCRVLVTVDGRITTLLGADANGWAIDLALCRVPAEELPEIRLGEVAA